MKHKSPKKRAKQDAIRYSRNHAYKSRIATATKMVLSLVKAGDKDAAKTKMLQVQSLMDGAATKGILAKNTVGRRVSRIMRSVNSLA